MDDSQNEKQVLGNEREKVKLSDMIRDHIKNNPTQSFFIPLKRLDLNLTEKRLCVYNPNIFTYKYTSDDFKIVEKDDKMGIMFGQGKDIILHPDNIDLMYYETDKILEIKIVYSSFYISEENDFKCVTTNTIIKHINVDGYDYDKTTCFINNNVLCIELNK